MSKLKAIYFPDRHKWRAWLEKNFDKEKEVWLIFPKKNSGKPRIIYNDAVEEALCFGWIDSIVKLLDKENSMQRFSPRNIRSKYSQQNRERLKWLSKRNMIHPSIQNALKDILKEEFTFPRDIIEAIKKDRAAWENYRKFSDAYKRIRVAYIDAARKRPDEFKKRLHNFMEKTKKNKIIGFGGIEKYY